MFDLDNAIAHWRQQMFAAGIKTSTTLGELESHLREEIEQQIQQGCSEPQAFAAGIRQIGESAALKREFARVGGTREFLVRKLVQTICVFNLVLGAFWLCVGFDSLRELWFRLIHRMLFDLGDVAFLWRYDTITIFGSIVGLLTIVSAIQLFRWRHSGFKLMGACSLLTILGVLVDVTWRISLGDFRMNFILGIILSLCLAYPTFLLLLCKNSNVRNQYV